MQLLYTIGNEKDDCYENHSDLINTSWHALQEKDARDIEIPNIRWEVFELMMRFDEL